MAHTSHILIGLLVLLAVTVQADEWLANDDPEALHVSFGIGENCPVTEDQVSAFTRDVLVRARIKLRKEPRSMDTALHASLDCTPTHPGNRWTIHYDVRLHKVANVEGDMVYSYRDADVIAGMGSGDADYVASMIRELIESVFQKYLEANFDLAAD